MRVHPTNPDILYLTSSTGIHRSIDGGVTWTPVLTASGAKATDLLLDKANPSRLIAALYHASSSTSAGVYSSIDGGTSWNKLTGCSGGTLPTATADVNIRPAMSGSRIFASFKTSSSWKLYRTNTVSCTIEGQTENQWELGWSTDADTAKALWSGIYADPTNSAYVYATGTRFWASSNTGTTFTKMSGPHADHHGFATDPVDPKIIYTACDGGIYRSPNRGASDTWTFIGEGLTNVEFYDSVNAVTQSNLYIGGTQDNGTIQYDGSSTIWEHIRDGDGATVDIDPTDAGILYSMHQYPSSLSHKKGTESWKCIGCGLPTGSTCFNFHFQVHPTTPSIMLASCGTSLWRTTNPSCTTCPDTTSGAPLAWTTILTLASGTGNVKRSAVDGNVDLYYVGTSQGVLQAGPAGSSWKSVFSASGSSVRDIEIDPKHPATVYVAFSASGAGRIYRLLRTSAAPSTMSGADITSNLPSGASVQTLAVDRMAAFTLYAGTPLGVYRGRSTDSGATWSWTAYNNGLPATVDVQDLDVHPVTGVMRAATFGRSAYEVNTSDPIGSLVTAEGLLTMLRVHDVGTGYGSSTDSLDVEVVIKLDSQPGKALGADLF